MGKLTRVVRPFGIGLAVGAVALLALAVYLMVEQRRFGAGAGHADGVVVEMVSRENVAGRPKMWAPIVRYEVAGKPYRLRTDRFAFPARFAVGDKLEVLYRPSDPGDARLGGARQQYTTAILVAIGGLCLGFMGSVLLFSLRRRS
jgi:hypothetical protein